MSNTLITILLIMRVLCYKVREVKEVFASAMISYFT